MSNYMRNYLHGTNIYLNQRKDMFRVNTDTYLLGQFMDIRQDDVVLDVGTNNGALLLYASLHQPKKLIGIDVWEEACELATSNLLDNKVQNFEITCTSVQEYAGSEVDVIVCNPPFFPHADGSHVNENMFLQVARHEVRLSLEELCLHASRLLKDNGRLYLVHRSSRLVDLIKIMDQNRLGIQRIKFVHDERKSLSTAVLMEAIKGQEHRVQIQMPITIRG